MQNRSKYPPNDLQKQPWHAETHDVSLIHNAVTANLYAFSTSCAVRFVFWLRPRKV